MRRWLFNILAALGAVLWLVATSVALAVIFGADSYGIGVYTVEYHSSPPSPLEFALLFIWYPTAVVAWTFIVMVAVMPYFWLRNQFRERLRRVRISEGCCSICGYDLRASAGRCPECGAEPGIDQDATIRIVPRVFPIAAVLALLLWIDAAWMLGNTMWIRWSSDPHTHFSGLPTVFEDLIRLAAASVLPVGLAWWFVYRRRPRLRRERGLCCRCGYNLAGNTSGVCPECGAAPMRTASTT